MRLLRFILRRFFFGPGEKHHKLGNLGGLEIRISTSRSSKNAMRGKQPLRCYFSSTLPEKMAHYIFQAVFFASVFRNWHGICLGYFSSLPSIWQIEDLGFDHRTEGHLEALQEGWLILVHGTVWKQTLPKNFFGDFFFKRNLGIFTLDDIW